MVRRLNRRRAGALALVLGVVVLHGWVADLLAEHMVDFKLDAAMPPRLQVVYLREMEPSVPPVVAPMPPAQVPRKKSAGATAAMPAASGAEDALVAQAPEPAPELRGPVQASAPAAPVASPQPPAASAPASASADTASHFAWPASTRLSYVLSGQYGGEIHGNAQVEWVRRGSRYQVHMDVNVGLFGEMTNRMTSDGDLTAEGLVPRTYDEERHILGRGRQRWTIRFEPDAILMPNGRRRERWPGVQDSASQMVQLTYLFTTQPEKLAAGNVVIVPLALPRNVDRWVYDVLGSEPVYTPFGIVDAVHLKPRPAPRRSGDFMVEIWFAPTLAYLPVRMRIAIDDERFVDLVIKRKPQLASE